MRSNTRGNPGAIPDSFISKCSTFQRGSRYRNYCEVQEPRSETSMNILVVDDSRAMRMILKRMLRDAGFGGHNIAEADDGVKAPRNHQGTHT